MKAFNYLRPSSLEEACRLFREQSGRYKVLAGGTDLLVQIKQGKICPEAVMSLRDISGLSFIHRASDGGLTIGAMTPLRVVETSEEILTGWPAVAEAAASIGSIQVRSRATLGGNLCNAAPSADMAPILMAYDATMILTDGRAERSVALHDFFVGPGETVLRAGELMKAIRISASPRRSYGTYLKAYRSAMDIAVVGVGIRAVFETKSDICRELRLVLGAVAPTPVRAKASEGLASGRRLDDGLIETVSRSASEEARPISDIRSTASYRKTLVKVLTRKALFAARDWVEGGSRL
jgi:carbon-monoxide dehydrogenase medium subunit